MKNIFLLFGLFMILPFTSKAQYDYDFFTAGVNVSLPIGVPADIADFGLGIKAMYLRDLVGKWQVGGTVGYDRYFADNVEGPEIDDFEFATASVTGLYRIGDKGFGIGGDLGYAFGISDNVGDGGLSYEPKVYLETTNFVFSFGYRSVLIEDDSFDSVALSATYKL
ncbi:MAG: hypothetical protein WBA16_06950 [Nonlabens sp.]